jgi:MFS family permease
MQLERPRILGIVFLIVLIDMIGFSVIFPLFPHLLAYYLEQEGTAGPLGRLHALLEGVSRNPYAVTTLFGGLLGSLYSLLQFIGAPVWGALSDRIGRRPTLILTLSGTVVSYLVWSVSGSFTLFIVSRLLGGMMAGNISTASAVVADTSEGPSRASGMGLLGAAIGLGFVLGPILGGVASTWNPLSQWPGAAAFGVNPFSGCAMVSAMLAVANLAWVALRLPETYDRRPRTEAASHAARTLNPWGALRRLNDPGIQRTNVANFFYMTAFSAMEFTLTFLAVERLGYAPRDNMWMFVFIGLLIALIQGAFVRRLVPALGERRVALWGIALNIPGFILVGEAHTTTVLYSGLALMAIGSALIMPCFSALVSRYTPADRQGLSLGVFRSLGSLARAVGPLIGAVLYWQVGSWAPYHVGACLLLVPLLIARSLPPVAGVRDPIRNPVA